VTRSGERVARTLHLRSTWFSLGELHLWTSSTHVVYGRNVVVDARASNVKGALLQERNGSGTWRTLRHVDHPAQLRIQPHANTAFRLLLPGTNGTTIGVDVAPQLRVQALSARLLGGKVLPRPSAPVEVWRRERGVWRVVAHPILDARGEFRTPLRLRPVSYKITVAADGALSAARVWLRVTQRLLHSLHG
jgi:hypothetical protein